MTIIFVKTGVPYSPLMLARAEAVGDASAVIIETQLWIGYV
jgi:hypothetical protein